MDNEKAKFSTLSNDAYPQLLEKKTATAKFL